MYSREERIKAIELFIKYDRNATDVVRELGYPNFRSLKNWYRDYLNEQETGVVWERGTRCSKYSSEQKKVAVEHYFENGRNLSRTVRTLGYPSRQMLMSWCNVLAPGTRKKRVGGIVYTKEQKLEAVIALCARNGSAKDVAQKYGIKREAIYGWKYELLGKETNFSMSKEDDKTLPEEREALLSEIETLKRQIKRFKMETAIWEGAAELIKKDPGVDPKNLTNKEKTILTDALRDKYL